MQTLPRLIGPILQREVKESLVPFARREFVACRTARRTEPCVRLIVRARKVPAAKRPATRNWSV